MTTAHRVLPFILAVLSLTAGDAIADSTADLYRKAFDAYQQLEQSNDSNVDLSSNYAEVLKTSYRLPSDYEVMFRKLDDIQSKIFRASQSKSCDWDVNLSDGLMLELPHLSYMNTCYKITRRDLERQMMKMDMEKITDRLISTYSMPIHIGPKVFLSTLIASSMVNGANRMLDDVISHGLIDPLQAERLLKAMEKHPDDDPFQILQSFVNERDLTITSIENTFQVGSDNGWKDEDILEFAETFQLSRETVESLRNGKDDLLQGLMRYWDDVLANADNMSHSNFAEQFEAIRVRSEEGEYGALAKMFSGGPSYAVVVRKISKTADELNERKKLVGQIANGQVDFMKRANAARWYAKAIGQVEKSESPWWKDDEARRSILADIAMASTAGRCEFAYPDDYLVHREVEFMRWPEHLVPWWLPGINDFIDYFLQESDQALAQGDIPAGITHLASACRIIVHLSKDPGLPSSIIAGHRCMDVLDRIDSLESKNLTSENRHALREALRDIPTSDPFGLHAATKAARNRLAYQLQILKASGSLPELAVPQEPDDVLYAMAWLQDLAEPTMVDEVWYWPVEGTWPDDLAGDPSRLDTFNEAAIQETREDGVSASEAWGLEVHIPLENLRDIATPTAATISEQGRIRLMNTRRSLR
ncbi:MAG: hypothetical protein P8M22_12160 [Phycisphaerales bacterium]|nr:hypothetical protein [Phycisphaerales bacterium]